MKRSITITLCVLAGTLAATVPISRTSTETPACLHNLYNYQDCGPGCSLTLRWSHEICYNTTAPIGCCLGECKFYDCVSLTLECGTAVEAFGNGEGIRLGHQCNTGTNWQYCDGAAEPECEQIPSVLKEESQLQN